MASGGHPVCLFLDMMLFCLMIFSKRSCFCSVKCHLDICFFLGLLLHCAKMIKEIVLFKPKRCGFCCFFCFFLWFVQIFVIKSPG